jgi:ribokinase
MTSKYSREKPPKINVVGSVNLDLVATVERLPGTGETVSGLTLERFPGGKGANQALAAHRLGADVSFFACVGDDNIADEALSILKDEGVKLDYCKRSSDEPTGQALIAVSLEGENQIVVIPGANSINFLNRDFHLPTADALICQLEIPIEMVEIVSSDFSGFFCINLAPAVEISARLMSRADLIVVNETEAAFYGNIIHQRQGYTAITYGPKKAELFLDGEVIAKKTPPKVKPIDTTGAGDAFTAALTVALTKNQSPENALKYACTAGALATMIKGAQTSLPTEETVLASLS